MTKKLKNTVKYRLLRASIVLLFLSFNVIADEISLKNGDRISGQLIKLSPTTCIFATSYQATLRIKRQHLLRLNTIQPVMIQLRSGEQLIGTLGTEQNGTLFLQSQRLGRILLQLSEITEITRLKTSIEEARLLKPAGRGVKKALKSSTSSKNSETIGEQPENNLHQLSMRESAVLLKRGEQELGISVSYTYDFTDKRRYRAFTLPLEWHFGITNKLESFINMPFIWAEQEFSSTDNFENNNNFGLGDVHVGLNYLLIPESKQWPEIIGLFNLSLPTGERPNLTEPNHISLGSGHWGATTGLTLVKTYDPVALFGGMSYTHTFADTLNGIRVDPGESLTYRFGVGFAINYRVALFSQFIGTYQTKSKQNGIKIPGSVNEPMQLEMGLTHSVGKHRYLQPALTFGLNEEATDVTLDITYIRQF